MARTPEGNRRPDIEAFLLENHTSFTFKQAVKIEMFDIDKSLKNQARLGTPINQEAVNRYTEDIINGDEFPPILVEKGPKGYIVLDGNHRLQAHKKAAAPIDVYVCEAPPAVLVLLTFLANTKHGLPSSDVDRVHHALFLIDGGLSVADAAARLSVPVNKVRVAVSKQNANRRADDAGLLRSDWERIPDGVRTRLGNINTDEGFKAAVQLVRDAGLSAPEVNKVVTHLNDTRSGARQAAMVAAVREEMVDRIAQTRVAGPPRKGMHHSSPRTRLALAMGHINALPAPTAFDADLLPDSTRTELADKVDAAIDVLTEIRKALH